MIHLLCTTLSRTLRYLPLARRMFALRNGNPAAFVAAAVLLALPGTATAAKPTSAKDAEAARIEHKALQAASDGDVKAAIGSLTLAILKCEPPNGCSSAMRARLHVSLGTVRGMGESDYATAKKEFIAALAIDPRARLAGVTTPKLVATFDEARDGGSSTTEPSSPAPSPAPAPAPAPEKRPEPAPPSKPDRPVTVSDLFHDEPPPPPPKKAAPPPKPEETGPQVRKNWVSARVQLDFTHLSDANVCSPGAPGEYYCTDESGARYTGRPQRNDDVSGGFALAAPRFVLGYERVFFENLTLGGFAGVALNLGPAAEGRGKSALPLHLEARATYTFGEQPYAEDHDGLHPFVYGALGAADFDTHVKIRVNEIPCGTTLAPTCQRELNAHRLVGGLYATVGAGARYQIAGRHGLRAGLRGTFVFGGGLVVSPELGYELGF